ncbi:MAG: spore cortex biosynthesis protein YabQ [Butyricicoccus sp.]|nr:spore cortex biosynthesis protein YabQ [Butyricicoccus sp.]
MTFTLGEQTLVFLEAILLGAAGGVCYDVCRALRWTFRTGRLGTALLDGVFWLLVLSTLFYFAVTDAAAQARSYVLLGEGLGMALYLLCLSPLILPVLRAALRAVCWVAVIPWRMGAAVAKMGNRLFDSRGKAVQILKKIKKKLPFLRHSS